MPAKPKLDNIEKKADADKTTQPVELIEHRGEDTRIASPRRIREELNDGRISVEERNTRPRGDDSYVPRNRDTRSTNRGETNRNTKVPVKERPQRSERPKGK